MKRLMTYTTFFISRNPFHRLVSAHNNKFISGGELFKKNIGTKIAKERAKFYLPDGVRYIQVRCFIKIKKIAHFYFFLVLQ